MSSDLQEPSGLVYAVLVNHEGWRDTIACLESLATLRPAPPRVVVCDNGSTDGSLREIAAWAEASLPAGHRRVDARGRETSRSATTEGSGAALTLMELGTNAGFAAGCNAGARLALADERCAFVWFLNNDTTVEADTLAEMLAEMERRPRAGLCGSTILHADDPTRVQALGGGRYGRWLGTTRLFGVSVLPAGAELERLAGDARARMNFVCGASLLASRAFLEEVGPMNEEYFLYYEEIDWALRAGERFELAYAPASRVHHAIGATIGSSTVARTKSLLADYYGLRNRILVTKRFHRLGLPTVYAGLLVAFFLRLLRRQPERAVLVLELALWGLGLRDESAILRRHGVRPT